ncbi:MAG TPA: hypothetical protein VF179_20285 [Thermoanaerobaculia bacterium]|nr:hypothetical protein [Thermoanaerobaculia bacterium]
MRGPYLGVTGFTTAAQVREALALAPPASRRRLMIGVLASDRPPERNPRRLPAVEEIPEIFPDHPLALNLVHYYTDEPATLGRQLADLAARCGPNLHGFQINGVWPSRQDLEEVRRLRIVVQMDAAMLEGPPEDAVRRTREIAGLAHDLLLDASGGQGRPLDPAALLPFLRGLAETGLGLGVAGGLSAANLHLLEPLLAEFPDLSFDAETCLRDEEDRLDPERVREYVRAGLRL